MIPEWKIWLTIIGLGAASFGLRFVFLGLIGDRAMPEWVLRHLRYTAVAVLPALIAPLVLWPSATDGTFDPLRFAAAMTTLAVGYKTRNVVASILAGAAILISGNYLLP